MVLVFDGKKIGHASKIIERAPGFHIVYTTAKTTADSYIEKAAFRQRDNYRYIYVVPRRAGFFRTAAPPQMNYGACAASFI